MIISLSKKILLPLLFLTGWTGNLHLLHAQTVTPATGGEEISADDFATGTWTTIDGPTITETAPGQLTAGNIRLTVPDGFVWDDAGSDPTVTVTQPRSQQIFVTLVERTPSGVVFEVEGSSSGSPPNNPHEITFGNLRVQPAQGTLASGEIRNTGSAAPGGTRNYGTLSMVPGVDDRIRVEDTDNASGSVVIEQDLEAGNFITVYSNVRDQFNNFKRNEAASWSLQNVTGGIASDDLTPAADGKSATFSGELTGTTNIQASFNSLTPIQSGTITVIPSDPVEMEIATQPTGTSLQAVAGELFSPQPEVRIIDTYGNTVDDVTEITAERNSGEGSLQGTTTLTVSNGIAAFSDLSHHIANDIDIRFTAENLPDIVSQTFSVVPADADGLLFEVHPSNNLLNEPIDPPVEVQIVDAFQNFVSEPDVSVSIEITQGSSTGFSDTSTNTVLTNVSGRAVFDNLIFDEQDTYRVRATASGLNPSSDSNSFTVAEEGQLAGFSVEKAGGGEIGEQTAGEPIELLIRAVDGTGATVDFTGFADLTTTGEFTGLTDGVAGPFTNGTTEHTVSMTTAGIFTITATNTLGLESGTSNEFKVNPAEADPEESSFTVNPNTLIADGNSQSTITVQLRDRFGNALDTGGDAVEIFRTGSGTLSGVTDNADGTYHAEITAPNNVGQATITARVNGEDITSEDDVQETDIIFTFGELETFLIEKETGGDIETQTAGESFSIKITALDYANNIVETFNGSGSTVEITSSQTITSGSGTTATFTNGVLASHSVILTSSGTASITARRTGSTETGTSNEFTVNPAQASPVTSTITAGKSFLQNNGMESTTITLQLTDAFGNNLLSGGDSVTLSATAGTLSGVTDLGDGTYTATLTAGTEIETAEITGTVNGELIDDTAVVTITEINRWTANAGGAPANATDWSNTDNWSLGSLPTTGQIVLIPTEQLNGDPIDLFPIISEENAVEVNPVLDLLIIEEGANVTLSRRSLTINTEFSGNGSFFGNEGVVTLKGNIQLSNFIAGSSDIYFTGSSTQTISGDFTGNNLFVQNTLSVSGYFEAFTSILIDADYTLQMEPGSQLESIGDITINGALTGKESLFRFGGDINGTDITLEKTDVTFNGNAPQNINGITTIKSFRINNPTTVEVLNDLTITDTLNIQQGQLVVNSGFNLATNVTVGETANIRMLREIGDASSGPGWRLLSTPLKATYLNFLDQTVTQGYLNSSLGITDASGENLQPNVLYYDETHAGTDNQRWRAPGDAEDNMATARGHFVYFFGDIPEDNRYNDPLPHMLDVDGAEHTGSGSEITLPVTYTAEADTGWNLVGNPYTATVDWDDGTWEKTNMSNAIYIWDEATNQYRNWNGITGSHGSGKIAPFQGFWVKANGQGAPSLKVRKETKTTAGIFRKSSSSDSRNDEWPVIELQAESGVLQNSTFFTFTDEGRNNIDNYDAYRLLPFNTDTYLEVFTLLNDGTELTINSLPRKFGKPIELPVHIDGVQNGQFLNNEVTLTWPKMEQIPEGWTITLKDLQTGETVNLLEDSSYNFTLSARGKTPPMMNTPQNFKLVEKSKAKSQQARFTITINPGDDASGIPSDVVLNQNYPNPFNPTTSIQFGIPEEGNVRVDIYDLLGRRVQTITDQRYQAGFHTVQFDGRSLASGIYFYRLISPEKIMSKRMTLIK